jgi:Rho GTPase-activating protein RGD1
MRTPLIVVIHNSTTFSVDLAEQMAHDGVEVPLIMVKCCEVIEKHGITTMGV